MDLINLDERELETRLEPNESRTETAKGELGFELKIDVL